MPPHTLVEHCLTAEPPCTHAAAAASPLTDAELSAIADRVAQGYRWRTDFERMLGELHRLRTGSPA